MGRTHLQDAVPLTLGQELGGYAACLDRAADDLERASWQLRELNLGATAVGTGLNAGDDYVTSAIRHLSRYTSLELVPATNYFRVTQSMGDMVGYSGALRRLAVELGKIASDLRLLSMGPRAGLSEIRLPAVQPGSSIMPGKVNPSVPEMVNQVCFQTIGCDTTVALAAEAGQLELNVMMPVIAWNLLHATHIMREAMKTLRLLTVDGLIADEARCRELLDRSTAMATALNPFLGYEATAEIAKAAVATGRSIRELVLERGLLDQEQLDRILSPGRDDQARDRRPSGALVRVWRAVLIPAMVLATAGAGAQQPSRHGRLFPPEDLGVLEGPDREAWQKPEQIMDALRIAERSVVADLGAGGGWFTVRLARRVGPNGVVYAEDIQPQMIEATTRRVQREGLHNVRAILGTPEDPRLPAGALDAVLIVDTYHEMAEPVTLLRNVARALKQQGRLGIVDFNRDGGGPGPPTEERVDPDAIVRDAGAAGLKLIRRESFLPFQFLLVFGK